MAREKGSVKNSSISLDKDLWEILSIMKKKNFAPSVSAEIARCIVYTYNQEGVFTDQEIKELLQENTA